MPDLDGFEIAELIKQRERTQHIPIIFLTALSKEEQHVFRGYSVGAVDYVFKPFDPDILRSKVAVFVELWEKNAAAAASRPSSSPSRSSPTLERASEERYRAARGRDAADRLDGGRRRAARPTSTAAGSSTPA